MINNTGAKVLNATNKRQHDDNYNKLLECEIKKLRVETRKFELECSFEIAGKTFTKTVGKILPCLITSTEVNVTSPVQGVSVTHIRNCSRLYALLFWLNLTC